MTITPSPRPESFSQPLDVLAAGAIRRGRQLRRRRLVAVATPPLLVAVLLAGTLVRLTTQHEPRTTHVTTAPHELSPSLPPIPDATTGEGARGGNQAGLGGGGGAIPSVRSSAGTALPRPPSALSALNVAESPLPPLPKIVFDRQFAQVDGENRSDIYVVNGDGTGLRDLTNNPAWAAKDAAWSPDGTKIAFASREDNLEECCHSIWSLFVMNADGTHIHEVAAATYLSLDGSDEFPTWSPDGKQIAFNSSDSGSAGFSVVNADGTDEHQVLKAQGFGPEWSPDGKEIAFVGVVNGIQEIEAFNPDGTDLRQVTHGPSVAGAIPHWSPDSKWISYAVVTDDGSGSVVHLIHPDGSDDHALGNPSVCQFAAVWSPDGRQMVVEEGASDNPTYADAPHYFVIYRPDGTLVRTVIPIVDDGSYEASIDPAP